MRFMKIVPYLILSCFAASSAVSHEFWISPEQFVYLPDERVQANLKVGQDFGGSSYSYNNNNFTRFEVATDGNTSEVTGRLGDLPAMSIDPPVDGLLTIVHETDDSLLTYSNWDKFTKFVEHKAFPTTLKDHVARGIPKDAKFTESYRRFAKSLVAIGDGKGTDSPVGLRTEIVALDNPYRMKKDKISVRVLLEGKPKPNTQVELFEKSPSGDVEITLHTTDPSGDVSLPIKRGHSYLVDAVSMLALENDDPNDGPVWASLWASLTFLVPQQPLQ